ncbi:hypothetical protein KUV26_07495 [Leisingera daeponensis]|uniref:Uncharacterized protein n=1 Tax=Leisingera daeponensis TaxID=405746 RepID=A0ABS7NDP0_9RHOB|nr:hypothetical protein [Leisingera daeponensis]MBY6139280.1 hypothetical protein [Leisingera daeponensis]
MSGAAAQPRGGVTVGTLSDLPPLEAGAVIYLRHWFSGSETRDQMRRDFEVNFGPEVAEAAFEAFGYLCNFCATHGRRPLVRHGMTCRCLGADENCFANLLASAAEGQKDDAHILASLIVTPRKAPELVRLASDCGLLMREVMGLKLPRQTGRPATATLH